MVIHSSSLAANQPTFAPKNKRVGHRTTHFGAATQRAAEQAEPPQRRSWFKTLLLGAGVIAGLFIGGKMALKHLSGTLFKQAATTVAQEAGQASVSQSTVSNLLQAGVSLLSKAGPGLLNILKSDLVLDSVIGGAKMIGSQSPAFKLVESYITKENLRKLLNPDTFKDLMAIMKENNLNSLEGIKKYVTQNADQLSALLGEDVASVLKQLFAAA